MQRTLSAPVWRITFVIAVFGIGLWPVASALGEDAPVSQIIVLLATMVVSALGGWYVGRWFAKSRKHDLDVIGFLLLLLLPSVFAALNLWLKLGIEDSIILYFEFMILRYWMPPISELMKAPVTHWILLVLLAIVLIIANLAFWLGFVDWMFSLLIHKLI